MGVGIYLLVLPTGVGGTVSGLDVKLGVIFATISAVRCREVSLK